MHVESFSLKPFDVSKKIGVCVNVLHTIVNV